MKDTIIRTFKRRIHSEYKTMKFYTIVSALGAAAQARGSFWLNPFYFDHKSQIEAYDCPYGPKRCGVDKEGDDIYCGEA